MALERVCTIGCFGRSEEEFFGALVGVGVDILVDIRQRRGVRGAEYAFVNHKRLVARLEELGIGYRYEPGLAPTDEIRGVQHRVDAATKTAKRSRSELAPEMIAAYTTGILDRFDLRGFVDSFGPDVRTIALFCVEQEPAACHRSIVAGRIASELGLPVKHL